MTRGAGGGWFLRAGFAECPGYAPEQGACMADYAGVSQTMHE
jgi:hypothetical protein